MTALRAVEESREVLTGEQRRYLFTRAAEALEVPLDGGDEVEINVFFYFSLLMILGVDSRHQDEPLTLKEPLRPDLKEALGARIAEHVEHAEMTVRAWKTIAEEVDGPTGSHADHEREADGCR